MSRPRAILLVGPVFSGKSRFIEDLSSSLGAAGFAVAGFFQRGAFRADGRKIGYDLVGLSSGSCRPLARRSEAGDRWLFDDAAFESARGEVREDADLVVIDEIGPLELAGKGHAKAVDRALSVSPTVLIVVREALADEAVKWLSARADVIRVCFEPGRGDEITAEIREILSSKTS